MPWGVAVTVCGLVIRIRGAKPGSAISLRCVRCFTCDDGHFIVWIRPAELILSHSVELGRAETCLHVI